MKTHLVWKRFYNFKDLWPHAMSAVANLMETRVPTAKVRAATAHALINICTADWVRRSTYLR